MYSVFIEKGARGGLTYDPCTNQHSDVLCGPAKIDQRLQLT